MRKATHTSLPHSALQTSKEMDYIIVETTLLGRYLNLWIIRHAETPHTPKWPQLGRVKKTSSAESTKKIKTTRNCRVKECQCSY